MAAMVRLRITMLWTPPRSVRATPPSSAVTSLTQRGVGDARMGTDASDLSAVGGRAFTDGRFLPGYERSFVVVLMPVQADTVKS